MVVAQWDDCCYIMRRDLLAERADNKSAVYWLKLAQNGKQKYMGRASPQEAEVTLISGLVISLAIFRSKAYKISTMTVPLKELQAWNHPPSWI